VTEVLSKIKVFSEETLFERREVDGVNEFKTHYEISDLVDHALIHVRVTAVLITVIHSLIVTFDSV
jgi:hypothetical protein